DLWVGDPPYASGGPSGAVISYRGNPSASRSQPSCSPTWTWTVGRSVLGSSKLAAKRWISPGHRSPAKLMGEPQVPQKRRRTPGEERYSRAGSPDHSTFAVTKPA